MLAVAGVAVSPVQTASGAPVDQAPRVAANPEREIEKCRRSWGRNGRIAGEVLASVWVGANGRVTGVSTPPDTEPLAAQAAQCAVLGMTFDPALRDGQPVAGQLIVPVGFVTPPQLTHTPHYDQWRRCYPKSKRNEGIERRVEVGITIGIDGKIIAHELPEGTETWVAEASRCILPYMEFEPGLNRGTPVESVATLPLYFKNNEISRDEFASIAAPTLAGRRRKQAVEERPEPRSSDEEIFAAYRECYPSGHGGSAEVTYQIRVEASGVVRKVEVIESSGDAQLDEAGACILSKLQFRPATFNGNAVSDTVQWPLLVRPPPATAE